MKRLAPLLLCFLLLSFIKENKPPFVKIIPFMNRIEHGSDTTYVINFWATWCGPCVAEMHYFEELDSIYHGTNTKVILVSLDFQRDVQSKVVPFLKKRNLKIEVCVLDETNDNEWIPRVDGAWQGNIPATLVRNPLHKFRKFIPRETTRTELDSLVKTSRVTN